LDALSLAHRFFAAAAILARPAALNPKVRPPQPENKSIALGFLTKLILNPIFVNVESFLYVA
jgi:hypothetical protein